MEDWREASKDTPLLCDLKPFGKYVMEDLHAIGGIPAIMRMMLDAGMLDGTP